MANMIARLGVLLGLDSAEFNKGIADSSRKLDAFVGGVNKAATIATAAFAAMTAKAMVFADEVADVAQANDVAIDTVIKLQNALANSGGKAESAGKMFASFTAYVDKAAEGSFEAQKNFSKMGIGLNDLANLSTQDLFNKAIAGVAKIEDPLTRSAKAMELFGKAAKGVDFVGVADGMKNGADVTDRQANAVKLLAEFYDKLGQSSRDATLNFINFLEPALRKINDLLASISRLSKEGNFFGGFIEILKNDLKQGQIQATLEEIERLNAKIADPNVGEFWKSGYRQQLAAAKKDLIELQGEATKAYQADVRRLDVAIDIANAAGKGDQTGPRRAVKKGIDPEEEKRKREAEARDRRAADALRKLFAEQEALYNLERSYGQLLIRINEYEQSQIRRMDLEEKLVDLDLRRQNMADYEFDFERKRLELEYQHQEALEKINELELSQADRAERIKKQNALYERQIELITKVRDVEALKTVGDVTKGFMDAAENFFRNLPTDMERGAAIFGSLMGNMSHALDNFVRTGKMSFKDLARSIIQDLIRIQMQAQLTSILRMVFGNIGTAFTYGTNIGSQQTNMLFQQEVGLRAEGGSVSGGSPYIVGERGPELFVPRSSGSIIPNEKMNNVVGQTVVNNYINAIDVKSFEQRLMGSSKAIWAANQYAQKGLAVTPGRM